MRTETTETKIYTFPELSESAKDKVRFESINCNVWEFWNAELYDTLKAFERVTGCKFSAHNHYTTIFYTIDAYPDLWNDKGDYFNDLKGVRALAWLENNVIKYIRKPKYLSMCNGRKNCAGANSIHRDSKCQTNLDNCNLTGTCYDNSILWPIITKEGRREIVEQNLTIRECIEKCLNSFITDIEAENEYMQSDEYLIDHCESNMYEFLESGELYA